MYKKRNRNTVYIIIAIIFLLIASLACGLVTKERVQETVVPTATAEEVDVEPTETSVEEEQPTEEIATEIPPTEIPPTEVPPTETPTPTDPPPSPTPEPEPIDVIDSGFGQDERYVGFAFLVANPNPTLAFESSQYQVAFYDENDIVVETESGYIDILLPGQTLGIGGSRILDEGVTVARMEVQLNAGDSEASDPIPTFLVENVTYFPGDYSSYVTGIVGNPYDMDLSSLEVFAVLYDSEDNIIGGGYTYLNFLLANSSTGAKVSVDSTGEVTSVELYPTLSGLSLLLSDDDEIPDDASKIQLLKFGFGQDDYSAGVGMLLENPNSNYSIEGAEYQVTAYSADGTVLETNEGYINLILPEETLGVGTDLYLEEGMEIDHIDVQILDGEFVEAEPIPLFTYESVVFQPGSYSSKVTGVVVSPYTSDITDLKVSAIAYDENGEIIGGGYTYLDFAPANGKAAVEVSVTVTGTPATVEIYASVTSLSEFDE